MTPVLTLICFDAFFCLYHLMLCTCPNDVTACFFVCKQYSKTQSRKTKWKIRDSKVKKNLFWQCIAVRGNFLRLKITHQSKAKLSPSWWKMIPKSISVSATLNHFCFGDVTVLWHNSLKIMKFLCCIVHVVYNWCAMCFVNWIYDLIGKHCIKPFWN